MAPHQRLIADVAGEYDPDSGRPAYPDILVVMPRRAGKTITVLAALVERMRRRPDVRTFYTAQTAEDALKVLRDEWAPIISSSPLRDLFGYRYARGDAGFYVKIGGRRYSRTEIFTPNANALHGRDSDLTVVDEYWAFDVDQAADIDAGIRPARWARAGSQIWYVSAGGLETSGALNGLIDVARAGRDGLAYFEWSADPDAAGYDPYDEQLWWATHPGLTSGLVSIETLRTDAAAMSRAELERALLCVWPRAVGTSLLAGWEHIVDDGAAPTGPLVLAFDVHPDRNAAAVAMAGGGAVELVDHQPGTRWLEARLVDLIARHRPVLVVRDPNGPAGATRLPDVDVTNLEGGDVSEACAAMVDAIRDRTLAVRAHPAVAAAFTGARILNRGDGRFVWVRRRADVDLTPLYAVTLAAWAATTAPTPTIY